MDGTVFKAWREVGSLRNLRNFIAESDLGLQVVEGEVLNAH